MFNETYGLQRAAIAGTKPMTRRLVPDKWQTPLTEIFEDCNFDYSKFWQISDVQFITNEKAPYKVGEVVAIAQSYKDVLEQMIDAKGGYGEEENAFFERYKDTPGWNNKMFVKAELMLNFIQFTDIKIERLQDISDEDCIREGVRYFDTIWCTGYEVDNLWNREKKQFSYDTPRDAFAALIDKVSGRGTWVRNPWVFAYSFELID